jgi:hypothetical protein
VEKSGHPVIGSSKFKCSLPGRGGGAGEFAGQIKKGAGEGLRTFFDLYIHFIKLEGGTPPGLADLFSLAIQ